MDEKTNAEQVAHRRHGGIVLTAVEVPEGLRGQSPLFLRTPP